MKISTRVSRMTIEEMIELTIELCAQMVECGVDREIIINRIKSEVI